MNEASLEPAGAATPPAAIVAAETPAGRPIEQYSRRKVFAVWGAAALPMGALSWVVAPLIEPAFTGEVTLAQALLITLAAGLIWQFVLVLVLVWKEQGSLRWPVLREALWLRSPRSPRTGRAGGRVWLVLVPLILAFGAVQFVPSLSGPADRDMAVLLDSDAGRALFDGAWGWFGVVLVMMTFNTVLGEELLFRGLLLPRMNGAFGRGDWVANGVLFAVYHLHVPWAIPGALFDTLILAYPTKRYRSAWIGIAVHSSQSVFIGLIVFSLVV